MTRPSIDSRSAAPKRAGVLRNMTWLGAGSAAVKPIWFVFITYFCINVLGDAGYGVLNWALITMTVAAAAGDLGTTNYSTREVARDPASASRYFTNFLSLRLVVGAVVLAAVVLLEARAGEPADRLLALAMAGVYTTGLLLLQYCRIFYRAFEVLRYEAVSLIVEKVLVVGGGIVLLMTTGTPEGTLAGMALGMSLAIAANVAFISYRLAPLRPRLVSLRFLRKTVAAALPIGIYGLLGVFYLRIGPYLLEAIEGEAALGRFSVAFRVIEALQLLPSIVTAVALPRLSSLFAQRRVDAFGRVMTRSTVGLVAAAAAVAAALVLFGPDVTRLLSQGKAAFSTSGDLLRLLAWAFPLMAFNGLMAIVLIAADEQRFLAWTLGFVSVAALAANLAFIPDHGAVAVCLILLCLELVLAATYLLRYRTVVRRQRAAR